MSSCNSPFSLEEILVPADVLPRFDELELGEFSLYDVYNFYGVILATAWQTLDLTTLEPMEAKLLGIEPSVPVMLFQCTSTDTAGRVVEFTRTYTRTDKAEFVVHFNAGQGSPPAQ